MREVSKKVLDKFDPNTFYLTVSNNLIEILKNKIFRKYKFKRF